MKLYLPAALAIAAAIGVAGCGVTHPTAASPSGAGSAASTTGHSQSVAVLSARSAASLTSVADTPPTTTSVVRPHFGTPQAAMRYLAHAYNRHDSAALHYVTNPSSFKALMAMRSEAVDLQFKSCTPTGHGDYNCVFRHRYPKRLHDSGYGQSDFIAAPAINPGWYMYLFEDCG
jgi:hypothetical protein